MNTLLDFTRIEAGHSEAALEPTDLATLTAGLASGFRSAIESVGLRFVVDCAPLPAPAYVDRNMWEQIVLNLVSNALKFTLAGEIVVRVTSADAAAVLEVRDTGIGIAQDELPRVFDRFHRVRGTRGRTQEGSGIGLALVQQLVRLQGGRIDVTSTPGAGSIFRVTLPLGREAAAPGVVTTDREPRTSGLGIATFVAEARRWSVPAIPVAAGAEARVLIVDDNADMREYVGRLLGAAWRIEAVGDGLAALAAARRELPALIIADVMMPGLEGFGLLAALRSDPLTRSVPVILLSAQAGEEARIEGLRAGADDYLVKPFVARELVARVEGLLALTRVRREADAAVRASEERYRAFIQLTSEAVWRISSTSRCRHRSRLTSRSPASTSVPTSRSATTRWRGCTGTPPPPIWSVPGSATWCPGRIRLMSNTSAPSWRPGTGSKAPRAMRLAGTAGRAIS